MMRRVMRISMWTLALLIILPVTMLISYGGCPDTRSATHNEDRYIECIDTHCHTCWRYARPVRLDFCVGGANGMRCKCTLRMVAIDVSSFKCDHSCNCTFIPVGRPFTFEVEERTCSTSSCLIP
ncbi:MAG: hypothetical protein KatS3mg019_1432 [Fimbriimonadales bacterium]|nr:MAG: hypothetical protein KatS3mg019_1432 [Fimbriimonadales bacterium]